MISNIIQIIVFQLLFLMIYELFLKKETFFQWNRFYLIFTSIIVIIIPFIEFEKMPEVISNTSIYPIIDNIEFENILPHSIDKTIKNSLFTLENFYYLGVLVMTLLFIVKVSQLLNLIKNSSLINFKTHKIVIMKVNHKAFTFLNYIFLSDNLLQTENNQIITHELIHVKQKHSLDLLFFEIQKIVFWFNPLVYIYQKKISTLHEYIADNKSIDTKNTKNYFENLLNQTFQVQNLSIVNNYNKKSILKKRIMMATKNKSKQVLKMKYLLIIPLVISMLIVTSCADQVKKTTNNSDVKSPPIPPIPPKTEEIIESIPFSKIEQSPIYPGCEEFTNKEDIAKCFQTSITNFISKNFNTKITNNLQLSDGKKRIQVQFIINEEGKVFDAKARAPHPKLKEEAIRVVESLPVMKPAKQDGKAVKMRFNMPIVFTVEK